MKNGLYNRAVYWNEEIESKIEKLMGARFEVKPTKHYFDKAHMLVLPDRCYLAALHGQIIEIEYADGIQKIVTRIPDRYNRANDICFAIRIEGWTATVKTVWVNRHSDNHYTIDESKYVRG